MQRRWRFPLPSQLLFDLGPKLRVNLKVIVVVRQGVEDGGRHESNRQDRLSIVPTLCSRSSERRPRQCLCDSLVVLAVSSPRPLSLRVLSCAYRSRTTGTFTPPRLPKVRLGTPLRNHVLIDLDILQPLSLLSPNPPPQILR